MFAAVHRPEPARRGIAPPLTRARGIASPIGPLALVEQDGALVALDFATTDASDASPLLRHAELELAEYFAGRRKRFTVRLRPIGSAFQLRAWQALAAIPYGAAASYGMIARALNSGPRAIGQACRSNPIAIFIPCHRVVAADGLGGFGGKERALDRKRALLAIEGIT
jgi:methylated-DNA-[protein]-cysteine S-methyltransferase